MQEQGAEVEVVASDELDRVSLTDLLWRLAAARTSLRQVTLPALVRLPRRAFGGWLRRAPVVLAAAGLPCFVVALADPLAVLSRDTVSYPGRRIALLIDATFSEPLISRSPDLVAGRAGSR